MASVYSLLPVLKTSNVDPGDEVIVDLYISGTGELRDNKLVLNYANQEMIAEDPGEFLIGVTPEQDDEGDVGIFYVDEDEVPDQNRHQLDAAGSVIGLPPWVVQNLEDSPGGSYQPFEGKGFVSGMPDSYSQILSETRGKHPPFRLKLNIDENAPSGDYSIHFVFTYHSGVLEYIYQDENEVTFHVNSRRESWEPYPTAVAVGGGAAAVLSLIYTTGFLNFISSLIVSLFTYIHSILM